MSRVEFFSIPLHQPFHLPLFQDIHQGDKGIPRNPTQKADKAVWVQCKLCVSRTPHAALGSLCCRSFIHRYFASVSHLMFSLMNLMLLLESCLEYLYVWIRLESSVLQPRVWQHFMTFCVKLQFLSEYYRVSMLEKNSI